MYVIACTFEEGLRATIFILRVCQLIIPWTLKNTLFEIQAQIHLGTKLINIILKLINTILTLVSGWS